MLILGIDTSSDICSVGLSEKENFLGEVNIKLKRRHSERLLPIIDKLFKETGLQINDIEGIVITDGPGSFTGLRIGLSTVQAFKQALDVPVYSVSSLEYMAYSLKKYYDHKLLIPTIDARNKRVYTALFESIETNKFVKRIKKDQALEVKDLIGILNNYKKEKIIFGSGLDNYYHEFKDISIENTVLLDNIKNYSGAKLATLGFKYISEGKQTDFVDLIPKYLKKPQAKINLEKKYLQEDKHGDLS